MHVFRITALLFLFAVPFCSSAQKGGYVPPEIHTRKDGEKYLYVRDAVALIKSGEVYLNLYEWRKKDPLSELPVMQYRYDDDVKYPSDVFLKELNNVLKLNGYIDTIGKVQRTPANTLSVDASIRGRFFDRVPPKPNTGFEGKEEWKANVIVDWKVLDARDSTLFEYTSRSSSKNFLVDHNNHGNDTPEQMKALFFEGTKAALKQAIADLQARPEFMKALKE